MYIIYIINLIRSYHSNLVAWHLDPIIGEFRHRWILHHKQAKKWKQYHIDDCSPHFQDFLLALYCYHLSPCFTFPYCTVYIRLICTCANITLYLIGKLLAACHAHRAKHGRCHWNWIKWMSVYNIGSIECGVHFVYTVLFLDFMFPMFSFSVQCSMF